MGFWNRDFFEEVSGKQQSDPDLFKLAEQFYPWWHRDIDGLFWKNLALTQMWTNISWHPPMDEESYEWEAIRLAINSADNARNLAPNISLPKDELEELEALLKHDPDIDDLPIPASNRIGFRRHLLRKHLTGSWSLLVPGYFYETLENDGSTVVLFYRDLTIHGSSLSFEGKEGSPIDDFDDPEVVAILDSDGLRGRAIVKKSEDPENDGWILDCLVSAGNSLCILTICFEDNKDKDWAISTFQTIQFETQQ